MTTPSTPPPLSVSPSAQATSSLAIWRLVLGILSFCAVCITGIPAVILGILALVKISKSPATLKGQGLAIGGLVTGVLGTFLTFITAAIMIPAIVQARAAAYQAVCLNNTKQLMVASLQYAAEHDDAMPGTLDQLKPYLGGTQTAVAPKLLVCPLATDPTQPGYEIVAPGRKLNTVADPAKTVFIREIHPHPNGRRAVGYMDGHVEMLGAP